MNSTLGPIVKDLFEWLFQDHRLGFTSAKAEKERNGQKQQKMWDRGIKGRGSDVRPGLINFTNKKL